MSNNGLLTGLRPPSRADLGTRVYAEEFGAKFDGVHEDQWAIQDALNHVAKKGGGQVILGTGVALLGLGGASTPIPGGNYSILVPDRCGLIGSGRSSTILRMRPSCQATAIELVTGGSNQVLQEFTVECNKANQTDSGVDGGQCGIYGSALFQNHIQRVHVKDSIREGFYISNAGWSTYIDLLAETCARSGFEVDAIQYSEVIGFRALNCSIAGLRVVGGASLATAVGPVTVLGGMAYGSGAYGIDVIFTRGTRIIGFKSRQNVEDGILVRDSADIGIIGCSGDLNERHGLYLLDSTNIQVSGGWWNSNNRLGAKAGNGIYLNNVTGATITGNRCNDHQGTVRQIYGITEAGTSNDNEISSNNVAGNNTAGLKVIGTTTRAFLNTGANPLPSTLTSPITVATSATETVLGTLVVPPDLLTPGSIIRVTASGVAGTHSTGTLTLTFRIRVNGVGGNIITNVVITEAVSQTNKGWFLDALCTVRTSGATGTVIGNMQVTNELTTTLAQAVKSSGTLATVVMNSTVQNSVVLTAQHGASHASNTVSIHNLYMEVTRV